jgi:hypothetical protein
MTKLALVKICGTEDFYVQDDTDGDAVKLLDADGEVANLGNCTWEYVRDLGVQNDSDDFHAAVATCPELTPSI